MLGGTFLRLIKLMFLSSVCYFQKLQRYATFGKLQTSAIVWTHHQWVRFRKPHGIPHGVLLRSWHDVPVLFQNQTDTAVSLWVSRAKCQFRLRSSSWPFCSDSPEWRSRHMVTWFGRHGDALGTIENAFFSCIYNPQITVSPTSSFSASFNVNRVKNHP